MAIRTLTLTMSAAAGTYIGDAAAASARNAIAAKHMTPISDGLHDGENSFFGFTSTAGFTDVTLTTIAQLYTEIGSTTINQKKRILCDWDGLQESATLQITGPAAAQYTNGATDWGKVRPDHSVWIMPAPGRTPIWGSTSGGGQPKSVTFTGFNWIHIQGMGLQMRPIFGFNASFPGLPIVAITGCFPTGLDIASVGEYSAITGGTVRALHVEDCVFEGCWGGIQAGTEYLRSWNNVFHDHGVQDLHKFTTFGATFLAAFPNWEPSCWIFGCLVYENDLTFTGSSIHPDFYQSHHPDDRQVADSHLIEFCRVVMNANSTAGEPQSQFIFAAAPNNTSMTSDWVVHNNIAITAANLGVGLDDQSGNGLKYIMNNTMARTGTSPTADNAPKVTPTTPASAGTTGVMVCKGNIYTQAFGEGGDFVNETYSNNLDCDPVTGSPFAPQDVFTGNGSWGTDGNGRRVYTPPDIGVANAAAARAAIDAFWLPLAGWNDLSGTKYGVTNPANWPATPQATIS